MARTTSYEKKFEAPSANDPANAALWMRRVAEQAEQPYRDYEWWSDFLDNKSFSTDPRAATPAIIRQLSSTQSGFAPGVETAINWNSTVFDNMNTNQGTGDLILPDQDQRYWWWIGLCLILPAVSANVRFTSRFYLQDRDPSTGLLTTAAYRYNQYMIAAGEQYMLWDAFVRTGGGRQRVTFSHGEAVSFGVQGSSMVWAVRICPDR